MAQNLHPSHWIAGFANNGTNITIPLASLPETDATEADGATGDIRKVSYAVVKQLYTAQQGEADADKPAKMVISRGQSLGSDGVTLNVSYTFQFQLAIASADVAAES